MLLALYIIPLLIIYVTLYLIITNEKVREIFAIETYVGITLLGIVGLIPAINLVCIMATGLFFLFVWLEDKPAILKLPPIKKKSN